MNKIYVVTAESGSYEDWTKWNEAAFSDKAAADAHAAKLAEEHPRVMDQHGNRGDKICYDVEELEFNADPKVSPAKPVS